MHDGRQEHSKVYIVGCRLRRPEQKIRTRLEDAFLHAAAPAKILEEPAESSSNNHENTQVYD